MLLASVDSIVSDLGFDNMTDIAFAVTQAVDAAEAQLSATLETEFDQGTFVDTFYVDEPLYRAAAQFRLSRGLVSSLTQVLANSAPANFNSDPVTPWSVSIWPFSNLVGGGNVDTTANIQFPANAKDKGVIHDFLSGYKKTYVRVTYVAGFAADASNPASYDLATVPDWLQQAAKTLALISLADSPALTEASVKLDTKMLALRYTSIITRRVRYAPLARLPL